MKFPHAIFILGLMSLIGSGSFAKDPAASSEDRLDGKKIVLARYAKAFVGQGNVTVEVAPYKKGDVEGAILLFHGIESPWDDKAINHEIRRNTREGKEDYATTYKGHEWVTLVGRLNAGSGTKTFELYVPEVKDPIQLSPSDGAAQLTTPRKIFQEYQEQDPSKERSPR